MKLAKAKVLLGASLRVRLARGIWLLLILVVYIKISLGLGSFSPLRWPHSRVGPVEILTSQQGYGFLHIGTGIGGEPLMVAGKAPLNSINVHADSLVRIRVTVIRDFSRVNVPILTMLLRVGSVASLLMLESFYI